MLHFDAVNFFSIAETYFLLILIKINLLCIFFIHHETSIFSLLNFPHNIIQNKVEGDLIWPILVQVMLL